MQTHIELSGTSSNTPEPAELISTTPFDILQNAVFNNPEKIYDWVEKLSLAEIDMLLCLPFNKTTLAKKLLPYPKIFQKLMDKAGPETANKVLRQKDLDDKQMLCALAKSNDITLIESIIVQPSKHSFNLAIEDLFPKLEGKFEELEKQDDFHAEKRALLNKISQPKMNELINTGLNDLGESLLHILIRNNYSQRTLEIIERTPAQELQKSIRFFSHGNISLLTRVFWSKASHYALYKPLVEKSQISNEELVNLFITSTAYNRYPLIYLAIVALHLSDTNKLKAQHPYRLTKKELEQLPKDQEKARELEQLTKKIIFALSPQQMQKTIQTFSKDEDGVNLLMFVPDVETLEQTFVVAGKENFKKAISSAFLQELVRTNTKTWMRKNILWLLEIKNAELLETLLIAITSNLKEVGVFNRLNTVLKRAWTTKVNFTPETFYAFYKVYPEKFKEWYCKNNSFIFSFKEGDEWALELFFITINSNLHYRASAFIELIDKYQKAFHHKDMWLTILNRYEKFFVEKNMQNEVTLTLLAKYKVYLMNGDHAAALSVIEEINDTSKLSPEIIFEVITMYHTKIVELMVLNHFDIKNIEDFLLLDKIVTYSLEITTPTILEKKSQLYRDSVSLFNSILTKQYKPETSAEEKHIKTELLHAHQITKDEYPFYNKYILEMTKLVKEHKTLLDTQKTNWKFWHSRSVTREQYNEESKILVDFERASDSLRPAIVKEALKLDLSLEFKNLLTKIENDFNPNVAKRIGI